MKELDRYCKYIPIMYALYIPINFYIHIYEVYTGSIMPVIMNILDLLKILVIVAFSYYVMHHCEEDKSEPYPSVFFMIIAGIVFLRLVFDIFNSAAYVVGPGTSFYIMIGAAIIAEFVFETLAFCGLSELYKPLLIILTFAIVLFSLGVFYPSSTFPYIMGFFIIIRDIYKIVIIKGTK